MDAVIQYAIYELFFAPEDIVIYGWSIGGFTAAYGAANYPIKALVRYTLLLIPNFNLSHKYTYYSQKGYVQS